MTDCLSKLEQLENLTTQAILNIQDALKENKDNKTIFMTWKGEENKDNKAKFITWEGQVLAEWIEYVVSSHPLMSNYLRGVLPNVLCDMMDLQVQNSSSEDELSIRRSIFDRIYSEHQYVLDVLVGHPGRVYQYLRLLLDTFMSLRGLLVSRGHLCDKNIYSQLSKYFNIVLRALVPFADEFINLPQTETECHLFVRSNALAIDGTHIPTIVNNKLQKRYRNRKDFTSHNVMAAVSFD
ncbi:hypothetical protein M5K25_018043 [Dendrobium thyrsiflorum]|uniref:Uncharacterized protein n=1 Tax=Dendrobium thyrsiflorum TaxID=117978 RepID=A0ABD0UHZ0_DENTH